MEMRRQLCTFYVDHLFFGVDVTRVQEVIRFQELTRVPLAADIVRGLMNLRGQIVTAVDMRAPLALPEGNDHDGLMNVVLRTDDEPISLLVDRIGEVLDVDEEMFEPPPETLKGNARELIRGAYKLDKSLLLHFDVDSAIRFAFGS